MLMRQIKAGVNKDKTGREIVTESECARTRLRANVRPCARERKKAAATTRLVTTIMLIVAKSKSKQTGTATRNRVQSSKVRPPIGTKQSG